MFYHSKYIWVSFSFLLTTIIVFLSEWITKAGIVNFPLGTRHILILSVVFINWLFYGRTISLSRYYTFLLLSMIIFLFLAFYISPANLYNYILGIGFTLLFVVIFNLAANTKSSNKTIQEIFNGLLVFILLMSFIQIFEGIITATPLTRMPGLFRELGAFSATMNIGVIIGITLFIITNKKKYLYLAIFFSFGIIMTMLKKSIVSNIITWIAFYFYHANSNVRFKMFFYAMIVSVLGYILIGEYFIDNLVFNMNYLQQMGPENHVRLGMYLASLNIASDFFPFGSGPGTFASLSSIINGYSSIHLEYGVAYIGANSPEDVAIGVHTLLDTFWPHIIGEFGILGTIIYLLIWFYPLKIISLKKSSTTDIFLKGFSFYILMIIITMTWEGFSLYTPEIPAFILLHSGLSGLCYFHIRQRTNISLSNS